jgi:hypothetical protein
MKYIVNRLLLTLMPCLFSCAYSSSDYTDDLGQDYIFVSESNAHQIISGPNDTTGAGIVPCTVEAYEYDSTYIIAKQRLNLDCLEEDFSKMQAAYWIIDKKKETVYGPLDSLSFFTKKKELMVSSSLAFKN